MFDLKVIPEHLLGKRVQAASTHGNSDLTLGMIVTISTVKLNRGSGDRQFTPEEMSQPISLRKILLRDEAGNAFYPEDVDLLEYSVPMLTALKAQFETKSETCQELIDLAGQLERDTVSPDDNDVFKIMSIIEASDKTVEDKHRELKAILET